MDEPLSKAEIGKDAIQSAAEAAATTVGEVTTIITRAVREVATVLGDFATEVFEIRDSSRRAAGEIEGEPDAEADLEPDLGSTPAPDVQVDEE